jgi:hypothetical protein
MCENIPDGPKHVADVQPQLHCMYLFLMAGLIKNVHSEK